MPLVRRIGVGERVERQLARGARQQVGDAAHFADEDRIPALKKLRIREVDAERAAQAPEIMLDADRAHFMTPVGLIRRETRPHQRLLACCELGPLGECPIEIDLDDDAAEIE